MRRFRKFLDSICFHKRVFFKHFWNIIVAAPDKGLSLLIVVAERLAFFKRWYFQEPKSKTSNKAVSAHIYIYVWMCLSMHNCRNIHVCFSKYICRYCSMQEHSNRWVPAPFRVTFSWWNKCARDAVVHLSPKRNFPNSLNCVSVKNNNLDKHCVAIGRATQPPY